ncbi:MAG TPA: DUF4062 domain-containing protein [Pirellulales bacterium]|jgi:hypothetical protein
MARSETVLSVFVASPADVSDERAQLEEVIRELNITWSRELALRFELVRWETHAYPSLGKDAQDVINKEIPNDYDIFVGIMGCKFGTPTNRAGSGTVEEFMRAKARHDTDSSKIKIMFYFKDAPVSPSTIDLDQLNKVREFKQSLGSEGGLYWSFVDVASFEKLLRLHLTRQVQAYLHDVKIDNSKVAATPSQITKIEDENEEPGILDLVEGFEARFQEVVKTSERITVATTDLSQRISFSTSEVNRLKANNASLLDRAALKRTIDRLATDMDQYAVRMEAEGAVFGDNFNKGMDSFIHIATLSAGMFDPKNQTAVDEAQTALANIRQLISGLGSMREKIAGFCEGIRTWPPMTTQLNHAKRTVLMALGHLTEVVKSAENLGKEAEGGLVDLLQSPPNEKRCTTDSR